MVSTDHFRQELLAQLGRAATQGRIDILINSGELYRSIAKGGFRSGSCCDAMQEEFKMGDTLLLDRTNGAGMTVRYLLPRTVGIQISLPLKSCLEPFARGRLALTRTGIFQCWGKTPMGTTPCPASGVWIRAASAQLPLRWGRFFATYGNERGRQLRRPYSAGLGLRFSGLGLRAFNSSNRRLH